MSAHFNLFTDRREPEVTAKDGYWVLRTLAPDAVADAVLDRLAAIDWVHPALLVYRPEDEDRWSFVTLGLRKPELGEGDG